MRASFRGSLGPFIPFLCVIYVTLFLNSIHVTAQQNALCDDSNPCRVGCCGPFGVCGFGDDYCGEGCKSNCNATAECGQYALEDNFDCPINVCCSKHGFCGTTEEFCNDGCQPNSEGGGCGSPTRKTCPINSDPLTYERRIAYYELFTRGRDCGVREPEDLPLAPLTHLNLAFVNFGSDYKLIDEHSEWVRRLVLRKLRYPNLRINIAIGGWAFNDPPTSTYFSDMASSYDGRRTFIRSVVDYLRNYGLDGVDIDWEYPGALDRGGRPQDVNSYVQLLAELRDAFEDEGSGWEISIAIPSSYWYLRGFNLENLQRQVDYLNLMSYDIFGMWDQDNEWTGPYLRGHTDWDMIENGLDLLWRNGIQPENVVMGFGFYGRSFTMSDPSCFRPDGVCRFRTGGMPGSCSDTAGVLTYQEIASRNSSLDVQTFYDPDTTVLYNVFEGSQWVSYDNAVSFKVKLERLSSRCLSGLMIWAIDQDTSNFTAMGELFGDYSHLQLEGLDHDSADRLSDLFGQFTGQDCFVTEKCTDGTSGERGAGQVCPAGTMSVETAHNPLQRHPMPLSGGTCKKGWYRHICCPKSSMPQDCEWNGEPERNVFGCSGKCGPGTFELNTDTAMEPKGNKQCYSGKRSLCCRSTKVIDDCIWSGCQGPLSPSQNPECPDGYDYQTYRYNKPEGVGLCREEYVSPVSGKKGSPLMEPFKSALCCPKGRSYSNCNWANDPQSSSDLEYGNPELYCLPQPCKQTQVEIADGLNPPRANAYSGGRFEMSCDGVSLPPNYDPLFGFCCDPPSTWNKDWPVDPDRLYELSFNDPETDKAIWQYDTQYESNDRDPIRADGTVPDGSDAYGFMMLNGEEEAIDDNFQKSYTVVRRTVSVPRVKRDILTKNQTVLERVFEHVEETFQVYCNFPPGAEECEAVWSGGAEDTIIRLPDHVGEGPFARVISMMPVGNDYQLPKHHLQHRSLDGIHDNPVYEVKVDYNFHLARQDRGPVQIRVDFTNLLGYWSELTDSEADGNTARRAKRNIPDDGFTMRHFRDRVAKAEELEKRLPKRSGDTILTTVPLEAEPADPKPDNCLVSRESNIAKRWWGTFTRWLAKLTTVTRSEVGDLPMGWADKINLFKASWGCPGKTWSANLRMDLEAEITMQSTYAYYYSGTFIPPTKPDVFFFFGIQPEAYVGLKMVGNAELRYTTNKKKIVDTLGYPGLAVKGIAAIGPTLDIYGQINGYVNIHGEAKAGARVTFDKSRVFWPQDSSDVEKYDEILNLGLTEEPKKPNGLDVTPTFEAGVQVKAEIDVILQPEANVGIQIGGGSYTAGRTLISAQITAFMTGILQFIATGTISTSTGRFDYTYGSYFYYQLGFKAKATVLDWANWALKDRLAYSPDPRKYTIYKSSGSIDLQGNRKRMVRLIDQPDSEDDIGQSYANDTLAETALLDPMYLFKRQDDDSMDLDPQLPQFTQQIQCPAGDSPSLKLPELRFNCGAFPPLQLTDISGQVWGTIPLCQGYKTTTLPTTLTHAPAILPEHKERANQRRKQQCPNLVSDLDSCPYETAFMHSAIGYSGSLMKLECDEFPWASSEEGGNFRATNERSQECVPSVQNGLGGQCIGMMNYMTQNVGKMDPETDPDDRDDLWIGWFQGSNTDFWYTQKTVDGVTQGWSSYEENQPVPVGYDPVNWSGQPADKSWTFKRNYTFSVIDDGSQASNWWDATGKQFTTNTGYTFRNPYGYSSVICAVNIFDQDDYYRNPRQGNAAEFNGLCYRGDSYAANGWPGSYRYSRCKVDFGAAVTKRSEGDAAGEKGQWEITGVTMLDDDFVVGEDVDWDLLAKQDAGQKTEASVSEAETPPASAKDSPSDSSVSVSLPTLDAILFPLDKA